VVGSNYLPTQQQEEMLSFLSSRFLKRSSRLGTAESSELGQVEGKASEVQNLAHDNQMDEDLADSASSLVHVVARQAHDRVTRCEMLLETRIDEWEDWDLCLEEPEIHGHAFGNRNGEENPAIVVGTLLLDDDQSTLENDTLIKTSNSVDLSLVNSEATLVARALTPPMDPVVRALPVSANIRVLLHGNSAFQHSKRQRKYSDFEHARHTRFARKSRCQVRNTIHHVRVRI